MTEKNRPRIVIVGDYNNPEEIRVLELLCKEYAGSYDIMVSGYAYGKVRKLDQVRGRCTFAGLNDGPFLYYKNTAEYAVITTQAVRYTREKRNQIIAGVYPDLDLKCFAGCIGDIDILITDDMTEDPAGLLEALAIPRDTEGKECLEYLVITCESGTDIVRDNSGISHFFADLAKDTSNSVIAFSVDEILKGPTSNVPYADEHRIRSVLESFRGEIIFDRDYSRAWFGNYLKEKDISFDTKEYTLFANHQLSFLKRVTGAQIHEEDDKVSEYVEYRSLMKTAYEKYGCENEKVSIIICRYNTPEDLLFRSIRSALGSGHDNVEVIVVDDGSKEKIGKKIAGEFGDDRVIYLYKENEGLGPSRDFGVSHATGKYVFYLDSDDTIHRDSLPCLVAHAETFGLDLVIGKRVLCDENGIPRNESHKHLAGETFLCYYGDRLDPAVFTDVMVNNLLINREFLLKSGVKFRSGLYEDVEYSALLYQKCKELHYLNVGIHDWYQYGDSSTISSTPSIANLKERADKEAFAWEHIPEASREDRLLSILNFDFNLYLGSFFRMDDGDRDKAFDIISGFFCSRKEYLSPELYPEKTKELALALTRRDREYFEHVVHRYYETRTSEEPHDDYIVFTHYHLYVACLRAIASKRRSRLYIGKFYAAFNNDLVYNIKKTGLFETVETFAYRDIVGNLFDELKKRPGEEDVIIPDALYNHFRHVFRACNTAKDTMYIFSDTHPYWYYVEREFDDIVKLEDAYNSFDREVRSHKLTGIWAGIMDYEGTIFPEMFFRSGKIRKIILSSMPDSLPEGYTDRIVIEDTKELDREYREEISRVMLGIYDVDASVFTSDATLLLTQPLALAGYCTERQQRRLMEAMCDHYKGANLLVKPHPADKMRYGYLGGTVLPKNVPIEVYNYLDTEIARVITFGSSAIETVTFARERINFFRLHDFEHEDVVEAIRKMTLVRYPSVRRMKRTAKAGLRKLREYRRSGR